jgi:hypothetical protein
MTTTSNYIERLLSPEKDDGQVYIYYAQYFDGTILYEYDNDHNHLDFNSIDQDKVKYFGFIGNGMKIYWDIPAGILHIGKREYMIKISSPNSILPIIGSKKDLITFKMAHTDSLVCGGSIKKSDLGNIIDGFYIGFKMNLDSVFTQILFGIPVTGKDLRPYFGVRISNKKDEIYTAELIGLNGEDESNFTKTNIELKDGKSSAVELYFQ